MSKYEDIVKKSRESYDRFFKDIKYIPDDAEGNDVTIDIENMQDKIKAKADQAEGHMKAIEKVKKEIEDEAKAAEEKTFNDDAQKATADLNKMYDEYIDAQKRLFKLQQQVAEKVHKIHED